MSTGNFADTLKRLDALVRRHWHRPLLSEDAGTGSRYAVNLNHLLEHLPDTGFDLAIGGNRVELVGRRYIDQIQYQFADVDRVGETHATIFATQQDFNAVFVEERGAGAVWGGLAGGEYRCFGRSLTALFSCLADCFEVAYSDGEDGVDDAKRALIRAAVQRNDGASVEGWMEYFYG